MKQTITATHKKLFKYTEAKWADSMVRNGSFRIGTLHEYRSYSSLEIGDNLEGTKDFVVVSPSDSDHPLTSEVLRIARAGNPTATDIYELSVAIAHGVGESFPVALRIYSPDCYVFCVTYTYSQAIMQQLGYNACVEISNPTRFLAALSHEMRKLTTAGFVSDCVYTNRNGLLREHNRTSPQLLKSEEYSHRAETRFLWEPRGQKQCETLNLRPRMVRSQKAAALCKRIF